MSDQFAQRYPVSVKGVLIVNDHVPLLLNEREEWELPGGKLDVGEQPDHCVVREIGEELNIQSRVLRALDNWVYHVNGVDVLIVTYLLVPENGLDLMEVSHEHKEARLFNINSVPEIMMPEGYKKSISLAKTIEFEKRTKSQK